MSRRHAIALTIIAALFAGGALGIDLLRREIGTPGFILETRLELPLVITTHLVAFAIAALAIWIHTSWIARALLISVASAALILSSRSIAYEAGEIRHHWLIGEENATISYSPKNCLRFSDFEITFVGEHVDHSIFRGVWPWTFAPENLERDLLPLCQRSA